MNETLTILPELRDLIPPLSEEELKRLHLELGFHGRAITPLTVWETDNDELILVDGHHRYDYCRKEKFDYEIELRSFSSLEMVKKYMVLHQLGRRNLDPKTASLLRGKYFNLSKKAAPNPEGVNQHSGEVNPQNEGQPSTAEQVASETGVSRATVERDAVYAEAAETLGDAFDKSDTKAVTIAKAKEKKEGKTMTTTKPKTKTKKRPKDTTDAEWDVVKGIFDKKNSDRSKAEKVAIQFFNLSTSDRSAATIIIDNIINTQ